MGRAEELYVRNQQAADDDRFQKSEAFRLQCLNTMLPRLHRLSSTFLALNEAHGFSQAPDYFLNERQLAGWSLVVPVYLFSNGLIAAVYPTGVQKVVDADTWFSKETRLTGERGYNMFAARSVDMVEELIVAVQKRIDELN